ncbi:hypothetical protein CVU37_03340 [candidate division BRC1 bacterium HGW-BRC1-1]|jgi:uncharacterized membrane protein YkvA (DUF1232 family)|nr:MAG: hypothetical protein CVU37_03340 [candidate division BRC1 bacterium HGW-BRC1-1]
MHELLMFFPHLAGLFWRTLNDSRVPKMFKLRLLAVAAYIVVPFDIVPDFVVGFGQIDDSLALLLLTTLLVGGPDEEIAMEHWRGSPSVFRNVRKFAVWALRWMPGTNAPSEETKEAKAAD